MADIFREKGVNKISEPEQLDRYVKVPTPFSWGILAALVIFLAGFFLWGMTGNIEVETDCTAIVEYGVLTGYIKDSDVGKLNNGSEVSINDMTFNIVSVSTQPKKLSSESSRRVRKANGDSGSSDQLYYEFHAECGVLDDGVYRAKAVTDTAHPIHFLLG